MKSGAMKWQDRPLWYDVWEKFPPKTSPQMDRAAPTFDVKKIVYPEDLIRALYMQQYQEGDVVNLRLERQNIKTKMQMFVETYIAHQRPGATKEEILQEVELEMKSQGKVFVKRQSEQQQPGSLKRNTKMFEKQDLNSDKVPIDTSQKL